MVNLPKFSRVSTGAGVSLHEITRQQVNELAKPNPIESMDDSEFDQFLKGTGGSVRPAADFARNVWLRIESAEMARRAPRVRLLLDRWLGVLTRPAVAAVTCAAMVAGGVWLGLQTGPSNAAGATAYIQSVNPFAHSHR
jgi:hypothetical protein